MFSRHGKHGGNYVSGSIEWQDSGPAAAQDLTTAAKNTPKLYSRKEHPPRKSRVHRWRSAEDFEHFPCPAKPSSQRSGKSSASRHEHRITPSFERDTTVRWENLPWSAWHHPQLRIPIDRPLDDMIRTAYAYVIRASEFGDQDLVWRICYFGIFLAVLLARGAHIDTLNMPTTYSHIPSR
ncbi:hypothetical protein Pst134EA_006837 [Puccinia striiformis f. sp. tritici]|uniref:hypothetical protein n=1 Tax=Puccinia striiformis f. sp. tritici TaxID=168172 RepID=UPI002008C902|nr:hypothetical protein Pst134EA_006837 [Puccinia striiformis f. sp. tritici]KAH9469543.1 hypothetical protein Pst134EA_006837 [Puccinia striiformis f. sp. tritici]